MTKAEIDLGELTDNEAAELYAAAVEAHAIQLGLRMRTLSTASPDAALATIARRRADKGEAMNLHGQIINLPEPSSLEPAISRHAAAELAQKADERIAELEAQLSAALERVAKAKAERDKAKATMQESMALMRDVY